MMANDLREVKRRTLGAYLETADYAFQEEVRRLCQSGYKVDDLAFINGWTQINAMCQLWPEHSGSCSHELAAAVEACLELRNQANAQVNVRAQVKKVLLLRDGVTSYPPWIPYQNDAVLAVLKQLEARTHTIRVLQGKLYLMITEDNLAVHNQVRELILETKGDQMQEPLHVTLINSDVLARLEHSPATIEACCETKIDDLEFYELSATSSLDYAPYDTCLVAKCRSVKLQQALQCLSQELPQYEPKLELHLTIWRIAREPFRFVSGRPVT